MNDFKQKVLDILQEDCRIPLEKMAVMLGALASEVARSEPMSSGRMPKRMSLPA